MCMKPAYFSLKLFTLYFIPLLCQPLCIYSQSPTTLNIQGVLNNANGLPVADGKYTVTFRVYDSPVGDVITWSELQPNVDVRQGVFSTILGKINPLNFTFDKPFFLGIKIGNDPELSPRIELTAAPYSLMAKNIEDNAISTNKIQNNAVTIDKIASPIVSSINGVSNDGGNVNLIAGANVSIASDNVNKTITISATGTGGGGGSGTITQLTEGNGIGIQNPAGPITTIGLKPNIVLGPGGSLNILNQNSTTVAGISSNINQGGYLSTSNAQGIQLFGVSSFSDGQPLLYINSKLGRQILDLKANDLSDAEMNLKSSSGNTVLRFTTNETGGGLVNVFNQRGIVAAGLSTNSTGDGRLSLRSVDNVLVLDMKSNITGGGFLGLYNEAGTESVRLTTTNTLGGRINVNNKFGRVAATLNTNTLGDGGLFISSGNELPLIGLASNEENGGGGFIGLYNTDANQVVKISTFANRQPYLALFNRLNNSVAEFKANEFSDGELSLRSVLKNPTVQVTANEGAGGLVNVFNPNGDIALRLTANPSGFLGIFNREKTEMIQLGIKSDQNARITVNNRLGNSAADLESNDFSDGSLQLYSVLKNPTLQLKANDNGGGLINLFRQVGGVPKIAGRFTEEDGGKFSIFNTDETEIIQLSALANRNARIRVNNRLNNPVADLISNEFSDGELTLRSSSKNPTVQVGANENAGGQINVYNKSSKISAKLSEANGFGIMKIFNPDGKGLAEMSEFKKAGRVVVYNPEMDTIRGVASMYTDSSGYGIFGVASKTFGALAELTADAKENGFLGMYHSTKNSRLPLVSMGGSDKSEGYLKLFNSKGLNTTFWGHNEFGDGSIELRNNLGNLGGFFTAFKDGGSIAVTDGKPGTNHRATIGVGLFGGRTTIFNNSNLLTHESTVQSTGEGITRIVNPNDIIMSRVELGGTANKDGYISTFDSKNKRNTDLRANAEGAGIITTYKNDKIQTTLNATTTGGDIEVFNASGSNTSVIGHLDDGRGKIEVGHSNGIKVARMTAYTDGSGYIGVDNNDKNEVVRLTANTGKGGGIGIKNALLKDIITLSQNQNNGLVLVNNSNGINTSAMGHQDDGRGKIEVGGVSGTKVARMTAFTDGSGYIGVDNVDKLEVVRITANNGKGGGIGIKNPSGSDIINLTQDNAFGAILVNNSSGGTMATITHNSANGGFIGNKDQNGKDAVWITSGAQGGGQVNTFNSLSKVATTINADASNNGNVSVHGSAGNEIARMYGAPGGTGLVSIFNGSGTNLAGLSFNSLSGGGYVFAQNSSGKELARMTTTNDGTTGRISIDNNTGFNLAGLTSSSLGTGYVYASAANGKNVAIMTTTNGGGGFVSATNPAATNVSYLASNTANGGYVGVANSAGNDRARLTTNTGGSGIMSVSNATGNDVVEASVSTQNHGTLATYNASGQFMGGILATTTGHGYLTAYNNSGNERAHMSSGTNGGEISLRDANGTQRMFLNGSGYLEIDDADGSALGSWFTGTGVGLISTDKFQHPRAEFKPGHINVNGTNGGENAFIGAVPGSPHLGYVGVCNGNIVGSPVKAGLYTNASNQGVMFADVKNFRMDYPGKPDKEIWYGSIEGPELAAYIRGTGKIINGKASIDFPDHYIQVANASTMTVIVTPLSGKSKGLAVVNKKTSGFDVEELMEGSGTYNFDWEVKCVRKGYENFEVVRNKSDEPNPIVHSSTTTFEKRSLEKTELDPMVKEKIVRQQ